MTRTRGQRSDMACDSLSSGMAGQSPLWGFPWTKFCLFPYCCVAMTNHTSYLTFRSLFSALFTRATKSYRTIICSSPSSLPYHPPALYFATGIFHPIAFYAVLPKHSLLPFVQVYIFSTLPSLVVGMIVSRRSRPFCSLTPMCINSRLRNIYIYRFALVNRLKKS
jgi:hypothetical protein